MGGARLGIIIFHDCVGFSSLTGVMSHFNSARRLSSVGCISLVFFCLKDGLLGNDLVVGAIAGPNGSSVLAGYTNVSSTFVRSTSTQWMAAKLDADGTLQWRWQVPHMPGQPIAASVCVTINKTRFHGYMESHRKTVGIHCNHTARNPLRPFEPSLDASGQTPTHIQKQNRFND